MSAAVTCGVTIYSRRWRQIRTCGAPANSALIFRGDQLFTVCSRHNRRLSDALPDLARSVPA